MSDDNQLQSENISIEEHHHHHHHHHHSSEGEHHHHHHSSEGEHHHHRHSRHKRSTEDFKKKKSGKQRRKQISNFIFLILSMITIAVLAYAAYIYMN